MKPKKKKNSPFNNHKTWARIWEFDFLTNCLIKWFYSLDMNQLKSFIIYSARDRKILLWIINWNKTQQNETLRVKNSSTLSQSTNYDSETRGFKLNFMTIPKMLQCNNFGCEVRGKWGYGKYFRVLVVLYEREMYVKREMDVKQVVCYSLCLF